MIYNKVTRRHFLQGAGGSFLALPFLPSLMSKAEAATLPSPKFMVIYWNGHGGVNVQNMYPILSNPAVAGSLQARAMYSSQNHNMMIGKLTSLRTTMSSNLPYLATNLDQDAPTEANSPVDPNGYSRDLAGADFDNGAARLTPIVGSFVNDTLMNKMNLVAGLDFMWTGGHVWGQTGNYAAFSGNDMSSPSANGFTNIWLPTIDAVAASYPGFYGSSNPVAKSVFLNTQYGAAEDLSGYLSLYKSSSGLTQNTNIPSNLGQAFNMLFGGLANAGNSSANSKKNFILNKVYADYVRVARGAYGPGRRIGQADRNRFEEFIANIASIIAGVTTTNACTIPNISSTDSNVVQTEVTGNWQSTLHLYNQLMVSAFACGLTQTFMFAVPSLSDLFVPSGSPNPSFTDGTTGPDEHQAIFHMHNYADRQVRLVKARRLFFQYGFYDLMQQLDALSAPQGTGTMLDQSLLFWTAECGYNTHYSRSLPMIMAGGAGGFIKTGNFIDYRNVNMGFNVGFPFGHVGVPYNRFLATVLQAMGLPPSAYELTPAQFSGTTGRIPVNSNGTIPGYGHPYQQTFNIAGQGTIYPYDYQLNDMSVPLPGLT